MTATSLVDIGVREIVETQMTSDPARMFRDSTEEAIREQRQWLAPQFFDESGGIILTFRSYVVRTRHHTILVDTCWGNDKGRQSRAMGHMLKTSYLRDLEAAGVSPETVDFVFCTHMHVDHVGWNTRLENGRWVPTFPKAKYLFGRREWDHWKDVQEGAFGKDAIADSVVPVIEAGQALFVDDGYAIEDGVRAEPLPGHTPGHAGLHLASKGKEAVLSGDMMHHALQVGEPGWNIGVCTDPAQAIVTRRGFLDRYADTDVLVLTAHFPGSSGGRIVRAGDGYRFKV